MEPLFSQLNAPPLRTAAGVEAVRVKAPSGHGVKCRCEACKLSVNVLDTPPPTVCPYCQSYLKRSDYDLPPAAPMPDIAVEAAELMKRLYTRPNPVALFLIAAAGTLLLSTAVYFQLSNIENYWYQPLVNLYSLIVGIFIVSRFVFASFYMAPPDVGYEPTVTVIVPCMNEEKVIGHAIDRIFAAGYPAEKLEVVAVNDGSRDRTLEEMMAAQARHPSLVVVDFEKNRGLSHGWAVATLVARAEILVCVDSDTFLFPGALRKIVQGFVDPAVGGVSGHCDVENARTNLLTRMQDVRYFFSYKIMKAAESIFGTVSCLPGCFSAYRRTYVLHVLSDWLNTRFWGVYGDFGDDRSLTNFILRDFKVLYDDEARATTIAPESWYVYTRQQARWMRSYLREVFRAGTFMWRKRPVPAISWYATMWLPLVEPFVLFQALVVVPFALGQLSVSYVIGVLAITLVWTLHFWQKTGRTHWWTGFLFTLTYVFFYSWQVYWALFTLRGNKWGTRG